MVHADDRFIRHARRFAAGLLPLAAVSFFAVAGCSSDPSAAHDDATGEAAAQPITLHDPNCDPHNTWGLPHEGFERCAADDATCLASTFAQFETRLDADMCLAGGIPPGVSAKYPEGARKIVHANLSGRERTVNLWLYALCPFKPVVHSDQMAYAMTPPVNARIVYCFTDGSSGLSLRETQLRVSNYLVYYDPRCPLCSSDPAAEYAPPSEYK